MPSLYDVHTHVGLDTAFWLRGWWPYAATAAELLACMDAQGIDRAVCFPFTIGSAYDPYAFADRGAIELLPGRFPFDRENPLLVQELERIDTGRRLHALAMIDPARRVPEQVRSLEQLVGRISGLKAQPTMIESAVRSLLDVGRDLLSLAEQHDLPIVLHTALLPSDPYSQVADCLAVAEAFPRVRFCLAHSLRFHADHLRTAAAMPNVWVDCSAHLAHCQLALSDAPLVAAERERVDADYSRPSAVLQAIHAILGDRYLWGSDNPFMSWCDDTIRILYTYADEAAVLRELPDPVRADMAATGPEAWLLGRDRGEA